MVNVPELTDTVEKGDYLVVEPKKIERPSETLIEQLIEPKHLSNEKQKKEQQSKLPPKTDYNTLNTNLNKLKLTDYVKDNLTKIQSELFELQNRKIKDVNKKNSCDNSSFDNINNITNGMKEKLSKLNNRTKLNNKTKEHIKTLMKVINDSNFAKEFCLKDESCTYNDSSKKCELTCSSLIEKIGNDSNLNKLNYVKDVCKKATTCKNDKENSKTNIKNICRFIDQSENIDKKNYKGFINKTCQTEKPLNEVKTLLSCKKKCDNTIGCKEFSFDNSKKMCKIETSETSETNKTSEKCCDRNISSCYSENSIIYSLIGDGEIPQPFVNCSNISDEKNCNNRKDCKFIDNKCKSKICNIVDQIIDTKNYYKDVNDKTREIGFTEPVPDYQAICSTQSELDFTKKYIDKTCPINDENNKKYFVDKCKKNLKWAIREDDAISGFNDWMLTTNWHNKYENKPEGKIDDPPSNKPSETLCKNYCISLEDCNSFDYAKDPAKNNSTVCYISKAHPDVQKTSTYDYLGKDGSMYNMHYIKN